MTSKIMSEKLLQIATFEEKYGKDHGITSVNAMKKYCSDEKYREKRNLLAKKNYNLQYVREYYQKETNNE